jgi:iron complex outermembrane receptor protein
MVLYHASRGRRIGRSCWASVALVAIAAMPVTAQTPWREAVTVTASTEPLSFDGQSRVVYVVTKEQMARLPVLSVGDALALLAPVDVRTRGVDGVQADYSVRGASFGQALVLVDGVRLNDAQSGHHNSDIPLVLDDIERIEVLAGAGSSLHGADALGGTINIVTKRAARRAGARVAGASFGTGDASATYDTGVHGVSAGYSRSDGFMAARDYRSVVVSGRTSLGAHRVTAGVLDREFGANGFYGASPSREWTSQALIAVERSRAAMGAWQASWRASVRAHRDRFLWDERRPGQFENRHRSYAGILTGQGERSLAGSTRLAVGAELGADWVRSSNLGDHDYQRGAIFAELRHQRGALFVTPGVRVDAYSRFGTSVSPSIAAGRWFGDVKVRGSAGHAFRVPTFTELYYRDPNHAASDGLSPERAWSLEGGADWLPSPAWLVGATTFIRFEDDVIDWIRERPADRWQTANIRDVTTAGVELTARRILRAGGLLDVQYAWLDSDAPSLDVLSKYTLDIARHRVSTSASAALPGRLTLGMRLGVTRRVDGRDYTLLDARVSRRWRAVTLTADVRNMLDEEYEEIVGVAMPGRSARLELQWTR